MRKRGARATCIPRACSASTRWRTCAGVPFSAQSTRQLTAAAPRRQPQLLQLVRVLSSLEVEHGLPAGQRHAEAARQGRGIGHVRDHARGKQNLVNSDAAPLRLCLGMRQGAGVEGCADEESVLALERPLVSRDLDRLSPAPHSR